MRRLNQLSKTELVFYSRVILKLQIILKNDIELSYNLKKPDISKPRFLSFHIHIDFRFVEFVFDRHEKILSYNDILIPDEVLKDLIAI